MKIWIPVVGILATASLAEIVLRFGFGFGRPPLYVADSTIGYRLAPNQKIRRFGNRIFINQHSMRADEIAALPAPEHFRLLLLGDSLANGNWWTDQSDILSELIAHKLQSVLPAQYTKVEPLNASANSWGPRNQLAYLQRYGTFGATALVLLLNTDDLFGTQPTDLQVGRDRNYPDRNPPFAIAELFNRLIKRNSPIPGLKEIQNEAGDRVGKNLSAIDLIYQQAAAKDTKFLLVLSPLKREIPTPRNYEIEARERLQSWAAEHNISYLDLLPTFQNHPTVDSLYRDHIHLSLSGNQLVANSIVSEINLLFP
ncbi:MAG: SGNH/GDSL hydrolase family protein [Cyanobacteria bacterium P01_D01_bin.1]